MPTISIIVPVYKVEPYINRCVQSILDQTYTDFELILVDDGSPDRCGQMCDEWATKDERIRVIHKENGGLSDARNAGLDVARGEYIGFVDSDDYIYPEMYEVLFRCAVEDGSGMVTFQGFAPADPALASQYVNREIVQAQQALEQFHQRYYGRIWTAAPTKLYKRSIFEGLRFREGIIYEDTDILPETVRRAGQISILPISLYEYVIRDGSIMHSSFSPKRYMILDVWKRYVTFFDEMGMDQQVNLYGWRYASEMIRFWAITANDYPQHAEQFQPYLDSFREMKPYLMKKCRFCRMQRLALWAFPCMPRVADRIRRRLEA